MKKITRKQLFAQIKNDPAFILDEKIFDTVKQKLDPQPNSGLPLNPPSERLKRRRKLISRAAAGLGLAACIAAGIILFTHVPAKAPATFGPNAGTPKTNNSASASPAHGPLAAAMHGPAMMAYYQYKDGYYKVEYVESNSSRQAIADFASIQDNIGRNLGSNSIYEIKGCDPAQSIAVFDGRYYYRADFVRKTWFSFNGRSYIISEEIPDNGAMGEQLGQAGSYAAYALSGADPDQEIAVGIPNGGAAAGSGKNALEYYIAYQLPASVRFQGMDYYLEGNDIREFSPADLTPAGSGESYDIYSPLTDNGFKQITVKSGPKAVQAAAFVPSAQTPPASWYNSPWESMYRLYEDIEWNNGDYQFSTAFDYMADQAELKAKIGEKLGDYRYPDNTHTYGIYEIKGIDPQQAIAVKNNQMYMEYDFAFDERIEFNGQSYLIQLDAPSGTRGAKIGTTADGHEVDSVAGVDPDKEVIVILHGGTRFALRK